MANSLIPSRHRLASAESTVTIEFKPFGVQLGFTPVVREDQSITLKVAPEVSSLDFSNGLQIQGFKIPIIRSKAAASLKWHSGSWLDPDTVVYAFANSSNKCFLAKANVFTGQETIIASFGRTGPVCPTARRWRGP